jgi:hypothetical protein
MADHFPCPTVQILSNGGSFLQALKKALGVRVLVG